jgi:hypothetical protein
MNYKRENGRKQAQIISARARNRTSRIVRIERALPAQKSDAELVAERLE